MKTLQFEITEHLKEEIPLYGLRILNDREVVREYSTISAIPSKVLRLKRALEENDVSPLHFNDVVKDYLYATYDDLLLENGLR